MRTRDMGFNNSEPSSMAVAKRYMRLELGHRARPVDRIWGGANEAMVLFDNDIALVLQVLNGVWEVVNETSREDFERNK